MMMSKEKKNQPVFRSSGLRALETFRASEGRFQLLGRGGGGGVCFTDRRGV